MLLLRQGVPVRTLSFTHSRPPPPPAARLGDAREAARRGSNLGPPIRNRPGPNHGSAHPWQRGTRRAHGGVGPTSHMATPTPVPWPRPSAPWPRIPEGTLLGLAASAHPDARVVVAARGAGRHRRPSHIPHLPAPPGAPGHWPLPCAREDPWGWVGRGLVVRSVPRPGAVPGGGLRARRRTICASTALRRPPLPLGRARPSPRRSSTSSGVRRRRRLRCART